MHCVGPPEASQGLQSNGMNSMYNYVHTSSHSHHPSPSPKLIKSLSLSSSLKAEKYSPSLRLPLGL